MLAFALLTGALATSPLFASTVLAPAPCLDSLSQIGSPSSNTLLKFKTEGASYIRSVSTDLLRETKGDANKFINLFSRDFEKLEPGLNYEEYVGMSLAATFLRSVFNKKGGFDKSYNEVRHFLGYDPVEAVTEISRGSVRFPFMILKNQVINNMYVQMSQKNLEDRKIFYCFIGMAAYDLEIRSRLFSFDSSNAERVAFEELRELAAKGAYLVPARGLSDIETINLDLLDNKWPMMLNTEASDFDTIKGNSPYFSAFHDVRVHFIGFSGSRPFFISGMQRARVLGKFASLAGDDLKIAHLIVYEILHEAKVQKLKNDELLNGVAAKDKSHFEWEGHLQSLIVAQLTRPYQMKGYLNLSYFEANYGRILEFMLQ